MNLKVKIVSGLHSLIQYTFDANLRKKNIAGLGVKFCVLDLNSRIRRLCQVPGLLYFIYSKNMIESKLGCFLEWNIGNSKRSSSYFLLNCTGSVQWLKNEIGAVT